MGDPITAVAGPIVKASASYVFSLINDKYQLWQGCEGAARSLESQVSAIHSLLEDAADRQVAAALTENLLDKLKEVGDDAEDLLKTISTDETMWRNKKVRELSLKLSTGNASEIQQLLARIEEIFAEKNRYIPTGFESSVRSRYKFSPPKSNNDGPTDIFVGRENDMNKVLGMVLAKRDPPIIVTIIGGGGVGKTTLAQAVFNDPRAYTEGDDECFAFRIWVCVTCDFDYRRILKEILKNSMEMEYDMNALSDNQLESRLIEFLGSYHFLLVLDDVHVDACGRLSKLTDLIIGKCWKGTILITSGSLSVAKRMESVDTHFLNPLGEEESLSLFKHMVPENSGKKFDEFGKSIVSKCNGLPLLVKAVGGLLSCFTDLDKWNEISEQIVWEGEGESSRSVRPIRVQPVLKLCYDHLPSHLKKCFAYCHVFPKGHLFERIELLKLWKSSSLIHLEHGTIDETAESNFDQLLRMSFFQHHLTGDRQRFQMYDLIQELAESVVSKSYFCQVKDSKPNRTSGTSRYASILGQDVEGASSEIIRNSKKLRALLLPREDHIPFGRSSLEEIFHELKYLRTLDLSGNALVKLPDSVDRLKLLHYLDLSNNNMKELPNSICSLLNLQTLKLLGCPWLRKLPKDLSNLTNLENLELDDAFWSKSPPLPPNMENLVRIKNLHAYQIRSQSGYGVDELRSLARLTGTLHISKLENAVSSPGQQNLINKEELNMLVLEWSDIKEDGSLLDRAAEEVLESLKPHLNLKALKIICYRGTCSPSPYESWIRDGFLTNLVSLSLNKCSKCKALSLGKLVKLQELEIVGMTELEEWTDRRHDYLKTLAISHCPKLRELPGCEFGSMSILKIENCASLMTLRVPRSVKSLLLVNNPVLQDVPHQNDISSRTSVIKIVDCPNLPALSLRFPPKKLELSRCHSQLPRSFLIPEFSKHLKHLSLDGFHAEEPFRIPNSSKLHYLIISNISGLARLPTLPYISGLRALYLHHCPDLVSISEDQESPFQGLPLLQILSLWNNAELLTLPGRGIPASITCLSIGECPKLSSLGPGDTLCRLTDLKDLQLNACPALQSLPEGGLPDSLVHLKIDGCPELSNQCQDGGAYWEKIRHIPDREIEHAVGNSGEASSSSKAFYRRFICCKGTATR